MPLPALFRQTEDEYRRLKAQLASKGITPEQFERALNDLKLRDQQGRYWMLGARDGRWHVYERGAWVQAEPSPMLSVTRVGRAPASVDGQPLAGAATGAAQPKSSATVKVPALRERPSSAAPVPADATVRVPAGKPAAGRAAAGLPVAAPQHGRRPAVSATRYAGLVRRAAAWLFDVVSLSVVLGFLLMPLLETAGVSALAVRAALMLPLWVAYHALLWVWLGQTPGMVLLNIRVVDAQGRRPGLLRALVRGAGLLISALPLGLGYMWAAFNPHRQALHDKLAGTYVILR